MLKDLNLVESNGEAKRLIKGGSIKINDEFFTPVSPKYDFLSAPSKLNIVYEDENILLIDNRKLY